MRVGIAVGGAVSIYLGYKLFCDVSLRSRNHHRKRTVSGMSGALLTVFGMAALAADVHGISIVPNNHPASLRQLNPAKRGSFASPGMSHRKRPADCIV